MGTRIKIERCDFNYRFKRGDVCNYCGTAFGNDAEFEISNARGYKPDSPFAKLGKKIAKRGAYIGAVKIARAKCENWASAPCPTCGRWAPEVYAFKFKPYEAAAVIAGVFLGGLFCSRFTLCLALCLRQAILGTELIEPSAGVYVGYQLLWCAFFSLCFAVYQIKRHIAFFRSPTDNLRAIKEGEKSERRRKRREKKGEDGRRASGVMVANILGVIPKRARRKEFRNQLAYRILSATLILTSVAIFLLTASTGVCRLLATRWSWAQACWEYLGTAIATAATTVGLNANASGAWDCDDEMLAWNGVLASLAFSAAFYAIVVWIGRKKTRFQGTRHFGCGWRCEIEKAPDRKSEAKLRAWQELERSETLRTIEILSEASELTEAGAEMLRVAREERLGTPKRKKKGKKKGKK